MDICYEFNEITFVWDKEKARKNVVKHKGIAFEKAAESFFPPFLLFTDASRNFEQRNGIIGRTAKGQLLFVVHSWINDENIRNSISAIRSAPNPGYSEAIKSFYVVIVTIASFFVFGSELSAKKVMGILMTVAGLFLIAL